MAEKPGDFSSLPRGTAGRAEARAIPYTFLRVADGRRKAACKGQLSVTFCQVHERCRMTRDTGGERPS